MINLKCGDTEKVIHLWLLQHYLHDIVHLHMIPLALVHMWQSFASGTIYVLIEITSLFNSHECHYI